MALLTLLYGNKWWTTKARDETRITASGMKFFKRAAAFAGLKERKRKRQK
jgi:hypothetical protein